MRPHLVFDITIAVAIYATLLMSGILLWVALFGTPLPNATDMPQKLLTHGATAIYYLGLLLGSSYMAYRFLKSRGW